MKEVRVDLGDRSYSIFIDRGALGGIGAMIARQGIGSHAVIISDLNVARLYGSAVAGSLRSAGIEVELLTVPAGEESKSLAQAEALYRGLLRAGLHRDGFIVALGGGVVGDLTGFVAATYLRGVKFVQVPTTLLAQVDSSVGGKVGVNHPLAKNAIGCFHQPCLVWVDTDTLMTLERREVWAGLGEVVKFALVSDANLFKALETGIEAMARLEHPDRLPHLVAACCGVKARVVKEDEREAGVRRILNFGHTIGHAIESATRFSTFRHGEAVAYGMRWAAWFSNKFGSLSGADCQRISALLRRFPLPPLSREIDGRSLFDAITFDKKQTEGGLIMVWIEGIGRPRVAPAELSPAILQEWIEEIGTEEPTTPRSGPEHGFHTSR